MKKNFITEYAAIAILALAIIFGILEILNISFIPLNYVIWILGIGSIIVGLMFWKKADLTYMVGSLIILAAVGGVYFSFLGTWMNVILSKIALVVVPISVIMTFGAIYNKHKTKKSF